MPPQFGSMAPGFIGSAYPGFLARGGTPPSWPCSGSGSPDRRSENFLSAVVGYLPRLQIDCALKSGGPLSALFMPDLAEHRGGRRIQYPVLFARRGCRPRGGSRRGGGEAECRCGARPARKATCGDRATAPGASREDAKVEAKLQKAAEIKALLDAPLFEPAPMVLS